MANTVDKMAQKRAMVSATLSATGASEFYTQDVEDMDLGNRQGAAAKVQGRYQGDSPGLPPDGTVTVVVTGLAERTSEKSKRTCALFTAEDGNSYYVWDDNDRKLLAEGVTVTGEVKVNVSNGRSFANLSGISVVGEDGESLPF